MNQTFRSQGNNPQSGWAKVILLGGVLLSLTTLVVSRSVQKQRNEARFLEMVNISTGRLHEHLRICEDLLLGLRGMVDSGGDLTQKRFHDFLYAMGLETRYPGLLAVGYGVKVNPSNLVSVEKRLQKEHGDSSLRVRPGLGYGEDAVVIFDEPKAVNKPALGFNVASIPIQKENLIQTRDTGRLVASAPTILAQASSRELGLVLRVPIYDTRSVPASVEARRKHFQAFISAVFLLDDLAKSATANLTAHGLQVKIADVTDSSEATPFFVSGGGGYRTLINRLSAVPDQQVQRIEMGGRTWELRFSSSASFLSPGEIVMPWLMGLGLLVVTMLLAGLVHAMGRSEEQAQELAKDLAEGYQRSESRLRAILKTLPDLVLVLNEDGVYVEATTPNSRLLVRPSEELEGRLLSDLLPPHYAGPFLEVIRRTLETNQVQSLDYSMDVLHGPMRFEARISPMDSRIDGKRCVVWVIRDVTEQRTQEENYRETQKLESLGILAGGIAHDFNNLLTAIQGHLSLGKALIQEGNNPVVHLDMAEKVVTRTADLAHQLLAYSGRGQFQVTSFSLNTIIEEMEAMLAVAHSKKVRLVLDLDPKLRMIHGDRTQIQQILMNLLTNASEAIGEKEGTVVLRTSMVDLSSDDLRQRFTGQRLYPGLHVILEVKDDGCGMTEEVLPRIFDPFFTTKLTGRGLGLAALRGIVRAHHGAVEVFSRPGVGTQIKLCFPAAGESASVEPVSPSAMLRSDLAGRMLLAEDEYVIRNISRKMSERMGFQVVEAADGEEAIHCFEIHGGDFQIAVLDITMPKKGGLEVYEAIRERDSNLPVLFCSGYSPDLIPPLRSPDEPRGFLQKPFTMAQFQAAVANVIAIRNRPKARI